MNAQHDLDQQLTAFLREGPTESCLTSRLTLLLSHRTDTQRVVIGPWRLPETPTSRNR